MLDERRVAPLKLINNLKKLNHEGTTCSIKIETLRGFGLAVYVKSIKVPRSRMNGFGMVDI